MEFDQRGNCTGADFGAIHSGLLDIFQCGKPINPASSSLITWATFHPSICLNPYTINVRLCVPVWQWFMSTPCCRFTRSCVKPDDGPLLCSSGRSDPVWAWVLRGIPLVWLNGNKVKGRLIRSYSPTRVTCSLETLPQRFLTFLSPIKTFLWGS